MFFPAADAIAILLGILLLTWTLAVWDLCNTMSCAHDPLQMALNWLMNYSTTRSRLPNIIEVTIFLSSDLN